MHNLTTIKEEFLRFFVGKKRKIKNIIANDGCIESNLS